LRKQRVLLLFLQREWVGAADPIQRPDRELKPMKIVPHDED